jgi:integrase
MRNPNGYGGVIKLGGKRRKPYCARITDGWETTPEGKKKQKYKIIGYFKKPQEALSALDAYHNNAAVIGMSDLTFSQVYDMWSKWKYDPKNPHPIAESNIKGYKAAYKLCDSLNDMKMDDIKYVHLQAVVDKSGKNEPILRKLKTMLLQVYDYAIKNDIVNKDYAKHIIVPKSDPVIERIPFTEEEIKILWDNVDKYEWIDTILIQIYTGMRITELLIIETKNIFIQEKYMIGGIKTEAGIDREIPLHDKILPLIQKRYNAQSNFLILDDDGAVSYNGYRVFWNDIMWNLRMEHLPHDCRHTFKTLSKKYKLDEFWVNRIMGHKAKDKMDDVYAHNDITLMLAEVNKLP